jgi:aspartate/methionine/tyrosine aminotransferase
VRTTPAYPVYEIGALFAEAWTYAVHLNLGNGYAMDPDLVPESVLRRAAIVFLNYPHNPTGFCLSDDLFRRWVEVREEYGFVLVSDECYVDLGFDGTRPKSLLEFGRKGCLVVHSLSKRSGMTGYRSGFVAGDAELIGEYKRFRASMGTAPQEFVQAAATVAWSDSGHVAERLAVFAEKRRVLLARSPRCPSAPASSPRTRATSRARPR